MLSGLSREAHSRETTPLPELLLSPPSQPCITKQETETSVAMKVLRSVSSSLLPPLLSQSQEEFTEALHRKIVVAIQKISWKVEACLSYSAPNREYNIHKKIFDDDHIERIGDMMITAPPEEHKLQNSPAHVSKRGTKTATPSPLRFNHSIGGYPLTPPTKVYSNTPSPTQHDDDYFRPKATRRTTVSISKLQVQNLGLNMVDVATLDNYHQPRSNTIGISTAAMLVQDDGVMKLQAVRDKVLRKLAKEFPQLKSEPDAREDLKSSVPLNDEPYRSSTPLVSSPSHFCGSPSFSQEMSPDFEHVNNTAPLLERTKSLEFDKVPEVSSPTSPSFHQSRSESRMSEPPEKGSSTMPHKRRGTFMKMIKGRKVRSFGRADLKTKHRAPLQQRNKSASEFFSLEKDESGSDPIEWYSRCAFPSKSMSRGELKLN